MRKYRTNAADTTHMNGWIRFHCLLAAQITVYVTKPKPIPFVIEYVNGMIMIASAADSPIARSWKSMPASFEALAPSSSPSASVSVEIMSQPTTISAAAVACAGTIPMRFEKNMNGMNSRPATTATQPVRPPAATPEPDSMYVVADEDDAKPPAIAAAPSTISARLKFGMFPSLSTYPAALPTPIAVPEKSKKSLRNREKTQTSDATTPSCVLENEWKLIWPSRWKFGAPYR